MPLGDQGLEALAEEIELLSFKGIGVHHGRLLHRSGIRSVDQLAAADPDALYEELRRHRGETRFPALRLGMVRVWVMAARHVR